MSFSVQLRLLLWKNVTLKQRKPMTLIFELFIPLALFIIVVAIRRKQPAKENPASFFSASPLPSAGLVAIMQSFCDLPPYTDEYGFPSYPNSTIHEFLTQLNAVAENHNFFRPGFSLDELSEVPKIYQTIIDDPILLKTYFESNATDIRAEDLFSKPLLVEEFLVKNMSLDRGLTRNALYNSTFDKQLLYHYLFNNPNVSKIFSEGVSEQNFMSLSPQKQQMDFEKVNDDDGLLFHVLRDMNIEGAHKYLLQMHPESIITAFKDAMLQENRMMKYLCSGPEASLVLKCPDSKECHQNYSKLWEKLCAMNENQKELFRRFMLKNINVTKVLTKIGISSWNKDLVDSRFNNFVHNLSVFIKFKQSLRDLRKLANSFPTEYCFDNVTLSDDDENNVGDSSMQLPDEKEKRSDIAKTVKTGFNVTHHHHISKKKVERRERNLSHPFLQVWKAMHKTLCGTELRVKSESVDSLDDFELSSFQRNKFNLLIHVLFNNPKVLYVPSGTEADQLVRKANQTFELLDKVNQYINTLQIVGEEIKSFLHQNMTRHNLKTLRNMQEDIIQSPLGAMFFKDPIIQDFISDPNITNEDDFMRELDTISLSTCSWSKLMKGVSLNVYKGFLTEDDMLKYFRTQAYFDNVTVLAGVVFNMNDDGSLPNHMIYKIRQNASFTHDTNNIRSRFWFPGPGRSMLAYYQFGFLWIQDILERSIIDLHAGKNVREPGTYLQQLPYPCFVQDSFLFMIQHVMPMCLTISWVYSVAMLVQYIVYEKEQGLKEIMRMMGLRNFVHWVAWFVSALGQMTITVIMLTFILKYGKILTYSDPWIIFLTLEIFAISLIMFSFLVSVLYSKAKIAAACAGIMYFMAYVPYMYIAVREEGAQEVVSPWVKAIASFLAPTAFGLGAKYFAFYEEIGVGMQWENIAKSPAEDDAYHLGAVLVMLAIDTLIYLILFWYIENVFPGTFGLPRPWYFPIQKSYWCGKQPEQIKAASFDKKAEHSKESKTSFIFRRFKKGSPSTIGREPYSIGESIDENSELFETEPRDVVKGVSISNLCKRYKGNSKYALRNLSLNLYEGQITALLGPVGCGKTTTMSILTGLFPPTSGNATIYGHNIRTGMDSIRNSLGICTQRNTLFDDLTVEEHIWFYCKLKGQDGGEDEIERLIHDLNFQKKRHQKVESLSGGMKRKLSVAIAFVGGSHAVFVDEPTAGVDPAARRSIWDLIIKYKPGRTILMSTHHMEEADILGDRIAIIENGKIKCCGSPLYLRHHLGDGYHLTVAKRMDSNTMFRTSLCCQHEVTASIRAAAPETRFIKESRNELHYILSMNDLKAGAYVDLFQMLATSKGKLHISSYGVKSTTMEEVFMKAITADEPESQSSPDVESNFASETDSNLHPPNKIAHIMPDSESYIKLLDKGLDLVETGNQKMGSQKEINSIASNTKEMDKMLPSTSLQTGGISTISYSSGDVAEVGEENSAVDETSTFIEIPVGVENTTDEAITQFGRPEIHEYEKLSGNHLILQQFCAILYKRYLCTKRNIEGLFSQVLLPAFFVSVAMSVALTAPELNDLPELILTPSQFYNLTRPLGNVFVYSNNRMDLMESSHGDEASSDEITETFRLPSGIGATCVLHSPYNKSLSWNFKSYRKQMSYSYFDSMCESVSISDVSFSNNVVEQTGNKKNIAPVPRERYYPICYCAEDKASFICPKYGFKDPKSYEVVTGDILIDISGQNESQYYLYTTDKFRLRRYGGISVGIVRNSTPPDFSTYGPSVLKQVALRHVGKVWYNDKGYHSTPTYLNVMNNAILRANIPKKKGHPSGFGITVINHPFPNTQNAFMQDEIMKGNEVLIAIFIIVAMSFVPASFVLFVVSERYNNSKHLQIISGVHPAVYLIANYIWDICNYVVPATFIITILLIFDVPAYTSSTNFPAVVSLFLMYGWCISPVMHCVSYLFKEPSSAYIFLIVINLFVGITCIVTSFLLEVFSSDALLFKVHVCLKSLFLVFPNYCLGRGLMDMAFNEYYSMYLQKTGQSHKIKKPFDTEIIGKNLLAMATTGIVFFLITLFLELKICRVQRNYTNFIKRTTRSEFQKRNDDDESMEENLNDEVEDEDVLNERNRILSDSAHEDILRVESLTKVYSIKKLGKLLAVDKLCCGVPAGECFGLLGVNGAGKSSTFKLLTGDLTITAGDAFINGFSVKNDMSRALSNVGYCPQFDALYDELSAREHLNLYAALRGIPMKRRDEVVDCLVRRLDLTQHSERPCATYSGGNRRKLSAAIALVGSPSVIFLDEPTSGQDPRSRRFLWDLILSLVKEGKSIVFTSHTLEECEVLCTRLGIMVNGRLKCLGSIQHLKNKFGNGYSIILRCCSGKEDTLKVERYFKKSFPYAVLKEKHFYTLLYEIPSEFVSLDGIFSKMEKALSQNIVEGYSVSQNTLDSVFINFAKLQTDIHPKIISKGKITTMSRSKNDEVSTNESNILPENIDGILPDSNDENDPMVIDLPDIVH